MRRGRLQWIWGVLGGLAPALLVSLTAAGPSLSLQDSTPTSPPPNTLCLLCHGQDIPLFSERDAGGARLVTPVRADAFAASVHGGSLCVDCHRDQAGVPHPLVAEAERVSRNAEELCIGCHEEAYEGFLESVHGPLADLNDPRAPDCVDCHGDAHEVAALAEWPDDERAEACGVCHAGAGPNFPEAMSHVEPSPGSRLFAYLAEHFLIILTSSALAVAIIYVELELLRWGLPRLGQRVRGLLRHE